MKFSRFTIFTIALLLLGGGVGAYLFSSGVGSSCASPLGGHSVLKSQLSKTSFDAFTKFSLPSPLRNPNGIVVASDNSVWFGEQSVPGVAHLFPNGTLVEYAWPFNYSSGAEGNLCSPKTFIWGIALWNGSIWASDVTGNQLVGLNPTTGSITTIKLSESGSFPFTLTVGPDNSLWFTEIFSSKIGRVSLQGKLQEYSLPGGRQAAPSEIIFVNSTLGYYVDVGQAGAGNGRVYSFDPNNFSPHRVGGERRLDTPASLALGDRGIWVTIHGSSNVDFYNFSNNVWTSYPTPAVFYVPTTLPYFIKANDSTIWFNEHFANRLARIDSQRGILTEYSLSNPPAKSGSDIVNALTFAIGKDKVWFTELTTNTIGYLDASYRLSFAVSVIGDISSSVQQGRDTTITFAISGRSSLPLDLSFSNSANSTNIVFTPSTKVIPKLNGDERVQVKIAVGNELPAGSYTLLLTASDELISQSIYVTLHVRKS
jgi:virginiamycin B lyase